MAPSSALQLCEFLGIVRTLTHRDPGRCTEAELLRRAALTIGHHRQVHACTLFMQREDTLVCEMIAVRDPGSGGVVCLEGGDHADVDFLAQLATEVAHSGESLQCHGRFLAAASDSPNWCPVLCQPLCHAGEQVGVAILRLHARELEPWHERLLELFSDLLGLTLVTARMMRTQRQALALTERASDAGEKIIEQERRQRAEAERLLESQHRRISYQASHDPLTGLLNRRGLLGRLRDLIAGRAAHGARHGALYLDVDRFRLVTDACGDLIGDQLMRRTGRAIAEHLNVDEVGGRMGNGVFVVLLPGHSRAQCRARAAMLSEAIAGLAFEHPGPGMDTTVSIGLASFASGELDAENVLRRASAACSLAREQGGNQIQEYQDGDWRLTQRVRETQWVPRLLRALQENRFELVAQPLIPLCADRSIGGTNSPGYELLLRYVDDSGALVSASEFIPTAERFGLSVKLDELVVRSALRWLRENPRWLASAAFVTINLSGHSLGRISFLEDLTTTISASGVAADKLVFEVTETAAISDLGAARTFFQRLRASGCRFALDDFGTGHASFAYLRDLPVDMIKIDGEFVRAMATSSVSASLVRTVNQLGHELGLCTVAECVESEAVMESLREIGVDYAQGFLFGEPLPLSALADDLQPLR